MDADEYRRFQEFQRFQDYQRFVEAQREGEHLPVAAQPGQPVPHHSEQQLRTQLEGMRQQLARIEKVTNPPTWKKILQNKWLHRAIGLIVVIILAVYGIPALIGHYFGNNDNPGGQAALHPGEIEGSGRLEQNPWDAVAAVYHIVAENPPDTACYEFSVPARTQFATDMGAATCLDAVRRIHAGLSDAAKSAYSTVQIPNNGVSTNPERISSCSMTLDAGPRLGLFVVSENSAGEWQITGHRNEPNPCPTPTTTSAPPTS